MDQQETITKLNINLLVPNQYQPRKTFSEKALNDLAISIKEYGIFNPILVRRKNEKYEIIAGERRYRAAKQAGLIEVPVIIKEIDDAKMAEIALLENIQREDITAIEEAQSLKQILSLSNKTEEELSKIIGKSQSYISNKLRLLTTPSFIQDALINRQISERHARSLMTVKDISRQKELLDRVINEKLTVKELDSIINEKKITEEEIQAAINDIMKSLNISDELNENKKEEKESDNMNNGNFFPNPTPSMGMDPNASLNTMNMQAMNPMMSQQQPMAQMTPDQMIQQPTLPVAPDVNMQPGPLPTLEPNNVGMTQPMAPEQVGGPLPDMNYGTSPIPNFGMNNVDQVPQMNQEIMPGINMQASPLPMLEPNMSEMPVPTASVTEPTVPPMPYQNNEIVSGQAIPNFDANIQPQQLAAETPETVVPSPQMMDPPLFSQPMTSPEPSYDVPVLTEQLPTEMPQNENRMTQVEEILKNNGINYKSYSNSTGGCIIIEL